MTLADVANAAGVSPITVSRALRHPEKVSESARRRIAQAISRLGYVPDPAARALASGRTNVIGVIILSITNNVFSDVLRGSMPRPRARRSTSSWATPATPR